MLAILLLLLFLARRRDFPGQHDGEGNDCLSELCDALANRREDYGAENVPDQEELGDLDVRGPLHMFRR